MTRKWRGIKENPGNETEKLPSALVRKVVQVLYEHEQRLRIRKQWVSCISLVDMGDFSFFRATYAVARGTVEALIIKLLPYFLSNPPPLKKTCAVMLVGIVNICCRLYNTVLKFYYVVCLEE